MVTPDGPDVAPAPAKGAWRPTPPGAPASVLVLGAGPIVIGQACEFDYAGAQACRALREEGCRVSLVNSNPATIMTDPDMADATYIESLDWETVAQVIAVERPEALLPTMGGQTALNCALDLDRHGVLERYGVRMIGATRDSIDKAENRQRFREAMARIGLETPRSACARNMEEARAAQRLLGLPVVVRPSFTLGGSGGGIAHDLESFVEICERGFALSPTGELQLDESLIGWKEMEMEVVRDSRDNCIVVCGIENVDPMGVHTGDSIAVSPIQTLTDKEVQRMRDASISVLREIGVATGGSNVQFAIDPATGRMVVVEMNPRVSRSSALASKATGFPIARVAAKLALGYALNDLKNEITGGVLPASFEPSIDYVVTKLPRFAFEKFPGADTTLTTQMKSVGEVMGIGRCFKESLQKALRGLETGVCGLDEVSDLAAPDARARLAAALRVPGPERLWQIADGLRAGMSIDELHALCYVDPWFLAQIEELVDAERALKSRALESIDADELRGLKRQGFSDQRLAALLNVEESQLRARREALSLRPVYKRVDSCAGEFPVEAACMYSTYEEECEARPSERRKIVVLGGGPNRIGQGIEFDYCCVQAMLACKAHGVEAIMVNCNPETVSTDFDVSDRLYFESLTLEDVLAVVECERVDGVIVQFGGQTPLKLARALERAGAPIIGTSPDAIDRAEDRQRFQALLAQLGLPQLPCRTVSRADQALDAAAEIGYPLVVRPSYVLGGQAMEVVRRPEELSRYMRRAVRASADAPVLLDRFLNRAVELDIDAVCDGERAVIGGIMQHVEQAGVHSGDSACSLPPYSLAQAAQDEARRVVRLLALELGVVGLINVQLAVQDDIIYVLEVNPRASRTVPFVSKAIGVSLASVAAACMLGVSLAEQGFTEEPTPRFFNVKESVFPFDKFPGVDPILGPEMKSTGEVMGIGLSFASAMAKSQRAASAMPPTPGPDAGKAFISVRDADKARVDQVARELVDSGFSLVATAGTARALADAGLAVEVVNKVAEGSPHIVDAIVNGEIQMIINTTEGRQSIADSATIRRSALDRGVYYTTTLTGAEAVSLSMREGKSDVIVRIQDGLATIRGERVEPSSDDSGRGDRAATRAAPAQK